jgi:hypothetical protein
LFRLVSVGCTAVVESCADEFMGFFVVFEFEMAAGCQTVGLHMAFLALAEILIACALDFLGPGQNLKCVVVTGNFVVAFAEGGEYHRVV